jgi:hypothetical protein
MKTFEAQLAWQRAGQPFLDGRHSRVHARRDVARSLKSAVVAMETR